MSSERETAVPCGPGSSGGGRWPGRGGRRAARPTTRNQSALTAKTVSTLENASTTPPIAGPTNVETASSVLAATFAADSSAGLRASAGSKRRLRRAERDADHVRQRSRSRRRRAPARRLAIVTAARDHQRRAERSVTIITRSRAIPVGERREERRRDRGRQQPEHRDRRRPRSLRPGRRRRRESADDIRPVPHRRAEPRELETAQAGVREDARERAERLSATRRPIPLTGARLAACCNITTSAGRLQARRTSSVVTGPFRASGEQRERDHGRHRRDRLGERGARPRRTRTSRVTCTASTASMECTATITDKSELHDDERRRLRGSRPRAPCTSVHGVHDDQRDRASAKRCVAAH